ncbi:hypothetical protein VTJ04DRAFT_8656 [Mycothermus thermophilus]|uniref:uncharacterized protein n=1 Tax=Humicola insolens TaxID=85995 RepID=UPI0037436A5E
MDQSRRSLFAEQGQPMKPWGDFQLGSKLANTKKTSGGYRSPISQDSQNDSVREKKTLLLENSRCQ